ncbi:glyoxalase [Xenorhabdus mauleonii]|uniref:Catechol 2,3-dioxygenase n=1 Tax=Xenorhabdus mauleonii TaxID=351675 RepID=A0A1I3HVB8_9GAMM|nr:VOC family protein [Xenorhabdus mauleonii]PHM40258.1 glyoxalase [Xenorhabdus mauleonii]SFI39675.1 Catechol 2,3-dioxygenase [Xenorhabdus mauleonii]
MLTLTFSTSLNAKPSRIWAHYVDFELRKKWELGLESFQFEGEIKTGQYGRMILNGMPEIRFYLVKVEVDKEFTDQVNLPHMGILTFCHQILTDENHMANRVQVAVSFEPNAGIPDIQSERFFTQVTLDLVDNLSRLKAVVEKTEIIESIAVKPNLQLVYVSDIERSTRFYKTIFNAEPIFSSPRYVAFSADNEAIFALWSGGTKPDSATQRFSEIGIMLPASNNVEQLFEDWKKHPDINIEQEIYTDVFGQTFLVKDPDGHIIRVCPLD